MSRGYWYTLIAVVGWLALTGWAEGHGGGKGNYYKQLAASSQSASPAKLTPLQNPSDTISIKAPCDPPIPDNERDLCQQWRMAEAADSMVGVSKGQLILTALSLIGLAMTVGYTRYHARIAGEANANALKAMKSDLRPWIKFTEIDAERMTLDEHGLSLALKCGFQNVGRSPARRVLVGGKIHFSKAMVVPWDFLRECVGEIPKTNSPYENTIFPQDTGKDGVSFLFSSPADQGKSYVYVFLAITYSFDDYADVHKTCRLYQFSAKVNKELVASLQPIDFNVSADEAVAISFEKANTGDYAD